MLEVFGVRICIGLLVILIQELRVILRFGVYQLMFPAP
jgi:hypothetical protein